MRKPILYSKTTSVVKISKLQLRWIKNKVIKIIDKVEYSLYNKKRYKLNKMSQLLYLYILKVSATLSRLFYSLHSYSLGTVFPALFMKLTFFQHRSLISISDLTELPEGQSQRLTSVPASCNQVCPVLKPIPTVCPSNSDQTIRRYAGSSVHQQWRTELTSRYLKTMNVVLSLNSLKTWFANKLNKSVLHPLVWKLQQWFQMGNKIIHYPQLIYNLCIDTLLISFPSTPYNYDIS
jgi:hypothetical protein